MANERITEDFVRDYFKSDAQFKSIKFEEQKSNNKTINGLLNGQSKTGGKGNGFPEFIISFPTDSRYLIVVECKSSPSKHESLNRANPKVYAVDGVLHYAKALSINYDVIAIGASGETESELLVSHFLWKKGANNYSELISDKKLLPIHDYLDVFDNETFRDNFYTSDIISKAIELNEEFQAYSIPEMVRCTVVSAILLALTHKPFYTSFETYPSSNSLGKSIIGAIDSELDEPNDIVRNKAEMITEFSKLLNEPLFKENTIKHKDKKTPIETITIAKGFIKYLKDNVFPLVKHSNLGYDILGRFYTEFIRYAGSQQKQGLVLTPSHITNLFCDLLQINVYDTVYDPCCGTGGFLISAMTRLFQLAGNDSSLKEKIRKEQITGVELRTDMFTYACAGMRLRGDGRSNLYRGSCFDLEGAVKNRKPTVAMLNPPYDHGSAAQMEFIDHALNVVNEQNGRVAAIVQISCAIKNEVKLHEVKNRILQKHHLVAVLSMPDDLFYPIGVVTCIMIFEANKPNKGLKTWFGYFKDDGLEKRKYLGRIDVRGRYKGIKEHWLSSFNNREDVPGLSVQKEVNAIDEWCSEAYMETNYKILTRNEFIVKMRDYVSFLVQTSDPKEELIFSTKSTTNLDISLETEKWEWFFYDEIFIIKKGFYNKKPDTSKLGEIPFIGATDSNNGITSLHDIETIESSSKTGDEPNSVIQDKIFEPNCITVSNNGSIGYAFYQPNKFTCSHDVNPLYLKNHKLNKFIAMFLCSLIELEQYRWAYGRKWRPSRMPKSKIKLPVTEKGQPNWQIIEDFIKSLPYSSNL